MGTLYMLNAVRANRATSRGPGKDKYLNLSPSEFGVESGVKGAV
jgi:hypothetical protein